MSSKRAKFLNDATEKYLAMERDSLNSVFSVLGERGEEQVLLKSTEDKISLAEIRQKIDSGNRQAMLELLMVVARALRSFDAMPIDTRNALAHGLETTTKKLTENANFLPKRQGRRPASVADGELVTEALKVAFAVEIKKAKDQSTLEVAIAGVAATRDLNEDTVKKYWKANHKVAKTVLEQTVAIRQVRASL